MKRTGYMTGGRRGGSSGSMKSKLPPFPTTQMFVLGMHVLVKRS